MADFAWILVVVVDDESTLEFEEHNYKMTYFKAYLYNHNLNFNSAGLVRGDFKFWLKSVLSLYTLKNFSI